MSTALHITYWLIVGMCLGIITGVFEPMLGHLFYLPAPIVEAVLIGFGVALAVAIAIVATGWAIWTVGTRVSQWVEARL